jgi:hypothetical protein
MTADVDDEKSVRPKGSFSCFFHDRDNLNLNQRRMNATDDSNGAGPASAAAAADGGGGDSDGGRQWLPAAEAAATTSASHYDARHAALRGSRCLAPPRQSSPRDGGVERNRPR